MDGMGFSLGIGMLPPKITGDCSSFCSARSKVSSVASTELTSLLNPNYTRLQNRQHGRVSSCWIYPAGMCVLENSVQIERAAGQHSSCAQLNFSLIWGLESCGTKTSVQTDRRSLPLCCKHNDTSGAGSWKTQLGNNNYFCRIHSVAGISSCYLKHLHTLLTSFL